MLVNTNGSNYEVFALLGEVFGSGCPLGYLLICLAPDTTSGAKQRYLEDLLGYFQSTWEIRSICNLTDKDWSEINAFQKIYPEAKHQLCFA